MSPVHQQRYRYYKKINTNCCTVNPKSYLYSLESWKEHSLRQDRRSQKNDYFPNR